MHRPPRHTPDHIWRVTGAVVLAHVGVGWAISSGLLTSVVPTGMRDYVIMASVVMDAPAPPSPVQPQVTSPAPKPQPQPEAPKKPTPLKSTTSASPPVQPGPAATEASPGETAPVVPTSHAAPAAAPAAPAATGNQRPGTPMPLPTSAQVVQPSTNADYLNNPAPPYPRISKRMGEQGTVILRVFINTEGRAEQAEIRSSSGYTRLDESALATLRTWRFVPGQRNGVPEAMWFNVPVRFVLD